MDDVTHYAHAMTGEGAETPRCGASGRVVLFAYNVTCPRCLAMLAEQGVTSGQDHDASARNA